MINFFGIQSDTVFAVQTLELITPENLPKLFWLFNATADNQYTKVNQQDAQLNAFFVGDKGGNAPPWSTNSVEITQKMGIEATIRIEEFHLVAANFKEFDPMLSAKEIIGNE
jgi:phosphoribosylformylglycinamidine synthase